VGAFGGADAVPSEQLAPNTQISAELGGVCELTRVRSVLYGMHTNKGGNT
jgi:hypothetical protein